MTMDFSKQMSCTPCTKLQQFKKSIESNGIYVSDLPHRVTEEDLIEYFNYFGRIVDLYLADSGSYCLVNFYERHPVDRILSQPLGMYGRTLNIRPRFPRPDKSSKIANQNHLNPAKILESIPRADDFKLQLKGFLDAAEAKTDYLRNVNKVCDDLGKTLEQISSRLEIHPFGSSVNGLALIDADLDVFYGTEIEEKSSYVQNLLHKAKQCLGKSKTFQSITPIPTAKVPIIKFIHSPTGLQCDLSFNNMMGVQNSRLLKFLVSLDERIKPLLIIVKYWARIHNLTGKQFSNYALTLLLVNFLQSLNDPIIPPLCELQADNSETIMIKGWNTRFHEDVTKLRPISNNLPVEELICRFFESMVKTDFANFVVCPFLGCLFRRDFFNSPDRLPTKMSPYILNIRRGKPCLKVNSPLCIQDPLELNLNVTKNLPLPDFKCLIEHCDIAARICHSVPPPLLLKCLLSTSFEYPAKSQASSWIPNPMYQHPIRPYITIYVPCPSNMTDEIQWREELIQKITNIFKKVLKIHVEDERKDKEQKPGSDRSFLCKGSQVLWLRRDEIWNQLSLRESSTHVSENKSHSNDEIQIIQIKEIGGSCSSQSLGRKRSRSPEDESSAENKRQRLENSADNENGNECDSVDLVVLDSEEQQDCTSDNHRCRDIKEEIKLTNYMVKIGHALPAKNAILDFFCRIGKGNNNACIEISDRRSRNNYFSSFCVFLDEFLSKHIVDDTNESFT